MFFAHFDEKSDNYRGLRLRGNDIFITFAHNPFTGMQRHTNIVLYMINRELIRIKAVQLVYANLVNGGRNIEEAVKEMDESLDQAYCMYHHMLNLICEVTDYAAQQYEITCAQLLDRGRRELPNDRFINNRFALQLESNRKLETFTLNHKDLRWTDHEDVVHAIYSLITESPEYEVYMDSEEESYETDREFWRTVYKKYIINNDLIDDALEEWSIYWNCDRYVIDTFVLKTIRRFEEANGEQQPLLEQYNNSDDHRFGRDLLVLTMRGREQYEQLITDHTRNWDFSRLAKMDVAVMLTALAEIINIDSISVNISINEYLNIAKTYCDLKNVKFINATLDGIVNDLRRQGKLLK